MLYRSFRQLLPAALLLMKVATGDCAPKATSPFTLKGEVKGRKYPTVLYLLYKENQKAVRDSAILNDGHFVFKGSISRPLSAALYLKTQDGEQFSPPARHLYLDPGVMTLEGKGGVDSAVVEGSPSTKLADDWTKISHPYMVQLELLRSRAYYNRGNSDSVRILKDQTDDALTALENALTVFVTRHPNSYVSWDLVDERRVAMHPNTFQPSFEALSPDFRNSPEGKKLAEQIVNVKQTEAGVRSPDFSQCDAHGNPISLRSLHGKYVLIDFWASWCGICRAENPNVLRAYNAYKDSGFTVLGVSLDDSKDKWLQAVREDNMPWQQVCDMKGSKNDVALLYGIVGIPQNVLLDPNGVIIAKNLRDRDLMRKLMDIFAGGPNMRLDGHISSLKDSLAVFRYYAGDKPKQDTVAIHDGSFIWQTVMPEPQKIQVMLVPSHHKLQFYSDIGYLELSGQADSLNNLKVKGSWLDEEAKSFAANTKDISGQEQQRSLRVKYIRAHPQSFLSLNLVSDMTGSDYGEVYPLYMSLTEPLRGTPTGHRIASLLTQHN